MIELSKRLTHTYVGTYQHLDKWQWLGSVDEIGSRELPDAEPDEADPCEPRAREVFVLVKDVADDVSESDIRQALHDTYTSWGCAHEYDCCGCRSYRAGDVERVTGNLWRVEVFSSRNY